MEKVRNHLYKKVRATSAGTVQSSQGRSSKCMRRKGRLASEALTMSLVGEIVLHASGQRSAFSLLPDRPAVGPPPPRAVTPRCYPLSKLFTRCCNFQSTREPGRAGQQESGAEHRRGEGDPRESTCEAFQLSQVHRLPLQTYSTCSAFPHPGHHSHETAPVPDSSARGLARSAGGARIRRSLEVVPFPLGGSGMAMG